MNQKNNTDIIRSVVSLYDEKKDSAPLNNFSIDIKIEERIYKLIRLDDEQYYILRKNSISIADDNDCLTYLSTSKNTIYSSLSKMYVVLKERFGESGLYYDDWKGAFSFPFLIYFQKGEKYFSYLLNIYNFRSFIEFKISKLIDVNDQNLRQDIYYEPFEEFSKKDIAVFIGYIVGFCTGYFESAAERYNQFFFKTVRSNLIIFGYKDGNFFDHDYEDEDKFCQAVEDLTVFQTQQ